MLFIGTFFSNLKNSWQNQYKWLCSDTDKIYRQRLRENQAHVLNAKVQPLRHEGTNNGNMKFSGFSNLEFICPILKSGGACNLLFPDYPDLVPSLLPITIT